MKEKIKDFIIETFLYGEGDVEYDEDLFDSGKIDSVGFIKLLTFIGQEFNVNVDMSEISMDKFSTINDVVKMVEGKQTS